MKYQMTEGDFAKMGVSRTKEGTIFTFEGKKEAECAVLLYQIKTKKIIRLGVSPDYCIGSLRSVLVKGLDTASCYYNYEIDGQMFVDPYAERIKGREHWYDTTSGEIRQAQVWGGFSGNDFSWGNDRVPEIPKEEMVLYKLHVRGFTMDGGVPGKRKGTFAGVKERLPYLKELGITSVELMPVYEFEEMIVQKKENLPDYLTWKLQQKTAQEEAQNPQEQDFDGQEQKPQEREVCLHKQEETVVNKVNLWGYIPGNYFAPKAAYAACEDEVSEYKELIRSMHELSMECIMEIFFDEKMNPNILLDALRFWVRQYHVDGFHLIGRNLPVRAISQDALLSRTKLFLSELTPELLEVKEQCPRLFLYSDEYLYPLRKLLNHMGGSMSEFANQQKKQHEYCGYVNYAAINNGFTLADVFSYSEKHNIENGENNADGLDFNYSANYGAEGATRKRYITSVRKKQMRNALAMVILAQGVPLIASGDEFGNSQNGNNNTYCQDNKTGWVNWKNEKTNAVFFTYVRKLLEFRKNHPVLHLPNPMRQHDYIGSGYPDLSYHSEEAWVVGFAHGRQYAGMLYCGAYAKKTDKTADETIYVAYNFHSGRQFLALPKPLKGESWHLVMDTALEQSFLEEPQLLENQERLEVPGMSILILVAYHNETGSRKRKK